MPAASSASDAPGLLHDGQHLQRAHQTIARGGLVEAQDWPEVSPPSTPPVSRSIAEHVTIADLGAVKVDARGAQRHLESEVAHHRADDRALQRAVLLARARDDIEQLIAIDDAAEMIDHDQAVAVAIERKPDVRAHAGHGELQQLRRHGAAAIVDVAPVGRAADRHDLGAEVREDARPHLVGGAIGAIDDDLHARRDRGPRAASTRRTPDTACAS